MLRSIFILGIWTSRFLSLLLAQVLLMLGCYNSPADSGILRWAYKWTREFARRMDSYRGELAAGHPEFPAGSQAAVKITAAGPDPIDSPKIVYTAEDDAAIDDFHRNTGSHLSYHSLFLIEVFYGKQLQPLGTR